MYVPFIQFLFYAVCASFLFLEARMPLIVENVVNSLHRIWLKPEAFLLDKTFYGYLLEKD